VSGTVERELAAEPEQSPLSPAALAHAPASAVLALQRSAGNRAVARFIGPAWREARFRSMIGSEAARLGQMLFHVKLADLLFPKVNAAIAETPALAGAWDDFVAAIGVGKWKEADAARAELKDTKFPAALLGPDDARLEVGGKIFETLWKAYASPTAAFPDLTPYVTVGHYQALRRWELQACKRTAHEIAKRYIAAGGAGGKRAPGTAIRLTPLVAGVKTDKTPLGGDLYRGTVATYSSELGKEVERMKRAIDDGWIVHARVLSGIVGGGKSRAEPEHSLLVYGYSGTAFEYFDPDVAGSNVQMTGFDRLYYDATANRLSTAQSEAEFGAYAYTKDGHISGYQADGVHRYQVSSIETV
jgi:hypothetical protein